ncbi:MAG: rod shape-determining protein MreC [Bacteroidota bacterium]
MGNLLRLFIRNGGFVTFVLLEVFCFFLVIQFNERQNAIFAHTSTVIGGNLLERRQRISDYIGLQERVDSLVQENARLLAEAANARSVQLPYRDTFITVLYDTISHIDSIRHRAVRPEFRFIAARVISNSISSANNWMMLNRGSTDGVMPNMAVVSGKGIIGIVRHVDPDFSMVMSVLHRQTKLSAALPKHEKAFGTLLWEGGDPTIMTLKYIPKHIKVSVGEPVTTSGFSAMFPQGLELGFIETVPEQDPEYPNFLVAKVRLKQDMSTVQDVYVVQNLFKTAIDSLQQKVKNEQ